MELIGPTAEAILKVGFPAIMCIILLWEGIKLANTWAKRLLEIKIGLYLILQKLDAIEDYEKALKELELKEKLKE